MNQHLVGEIDQSVEKHEVVSDHWHKMLDMRIETGYPHDEPRDKPHIARSCGRALVWYRGVLIDIFHGGPAHHRAAHWHAIERACYHARQWAKR